MKPLYRRKIVIIPLALVAGFLLWRHYLFAPMPYRLDPRLVEVADTFHDIAARHDEDTISIHNGMIEPKHLRSVIPEKLISDLDSADIYRASFSRSCRNTCEHRATFYIDRLFVPFNMFEPRWYFSYDSAGHREEMTAPSLKDALKNRDETLPYYLICQPQEPRNWFLCTSYNP